MIQIGPSTDGLWRVGRAGTVLHTCQPGEGLEVATVVATKLRTAGEQMRRQFWSVAAAPPPGDIRRRIDIGSKTPAEPPVISERAITELLTGTVRAIDLVISAGDWDEALTRIADLEEATANRKGVRRAVESRRDDLDR